MTDPLDASPDPVVNGPARRISTPWRAAAVVVVIAVLLVAAGMRHPDPTAVTRVSPDDAPFATPFAASTAAPMPSGVPFSIRAMVLVNRTRTPITITSIRVRDVDAAVTVLGVKLDPSPTRGTYPIGPQAGFPAPNPGSAYRDPPLEIRPTTGASDGGVDVIVGLLANRTGLWGAKNIEISYRRDGRDHVTTYPVGFLVCADLGAPCGANI